MQYATEKTNFQHFRIIYSEVIRSCRGMFTSLSFLDIDRPKSLYNIDHMKLRPLR